MKSTIPATILLLCSLGFTAFANDDIISKGKAPKWNSSTSTEELTKLCSLEKNQNQKVLVCNIAVSRYASMGLGSIPKEGKSQASELLQIYDANPKDAQYIFGLHDSHMTLGRIALGAGDLKTAKDELLKSIQVPVTPALQHIGPRMTLVKELLEQGEKKAVLEYLDQVEKVWIQEGSKSKLTKWRAEIIAGKTPSFH